MNAGRGGHGEVLAKLKGEGAGGKNGKQALVLLRDRKRASYREFSSCGTGTNWGVDEVIERMEDDKSKGGVQQIILQCRPGT